MIAKSHSETLVTETPTQAPPKKRRSWLRRLFILAIILLLLGWLANGPLARWALHHGLRDTLRSLGMEGQVTVDGSVLSGISLLDVNCSGNNGVKKINVKRIDLDYRILELFDGKIRGLDVRNVDLVIDYAQFPKSEQQDEDNTSAHRKTLAQLRPYLTAPRIHFENLNVELLNDGKKSAVFGVGTLHHDAGSGIYELSSFQASDALDQSTPLQNIRFIWNSESATLERLELLPDVVLARTNIDWSKALKGDTLLQIDSAELAINLTNTLDLHLTKGAIHSAFLQERFTLDLPAQFTIDSLQAEITSWQMPVPLWKMKGKLGIKSLDTGTLDTGIYALQNTTIEFTQNEARYQLKLAGEINGADIEATTDGSWTSPVEPEWWGNTQLQYTLKGDKLNTLAKPWLHQREKIDLSQASLDLKGEAKLSNLSLIHISALGMSRGTRVNDLEIPQCSFNAQLRESNIHASLSFGTANSPRAMFSGDFHLKSADYNGSLEMNESDPSWLNELAAAFEAPVPVPIALGNPLQLKWSGKGNIHQGKIQTGNLAIENLTLSTPEFPQIQLKGKVNYDWPQNVVVTDLEALKGDWKGQGDLSWNGKDLRLQSVSISNKDQRVVTLTGYTPLQSNLKSGAHFFNQKQPWDLKVDLKPLALQQLNDWLSLNINKDIAGEARVNLHISGSPFACEVNGNTSLTKITGLDAEQREAIDAEMTFRSENKQLLVTGKIMEGTTERLNGKLLLPFVPNRIFDDPNLAKKWLYASKLEGTASINTLSLERFSRFIPELEKIKGTVNGTAKLSGTLNNPHYALDLQVKAPLIRLSKSNLANLRDVKLTATIDESQVVRSRISARISGGELEISGTADLTEIENPLLDIGVKSNHALIHRNDLISVRANSDLRITGKLKDATVRGKIGLVESLIYKDMDLIPIGVPASEVAKVKLPALDAKKASKGFPIPEPFGSWKLNIDIATTDPVLVRGNVASGHIHGSLHVGGTASDPQPNGTLIAQNIKARLPFSMLNIERGEIRFTPDNRFDPSLLIRGKSTVGFYDVSVFIHGLGSSPKTTLTSSPPLPENEIMALLASGSTTSELADPDVARFKAFQIFLMKLRQRIDKPGGNKLFHRLLGGIGDLNINVGEKNRLTGRRFSSATIKLNQRWHVTTQVDTQVDAQADAQQETRGLIVYVIQFR